MKLWQWVATFSSFVILGAGSGGCGGARPVDDSASRSEALSSGTLTCSTLTVAHGRIGGGQGAAALATRDLSGTADAWSSYVELSPGSSIVCRYPLGAADAAGLGGLGLRVNFRGPTAAEMRWTFDVWDGAAGRWARVGDNAFAAEWVWTGATLAVPVATANLVQNGEIRVRFGTTSQADAADLDEMVLVTTPEPEPEPESEPAPAPAPTPTPAPAPAPTATPTPAPAPAPSPAPAPTAWWQPRPGTSWQIQLQGTLNTSIAASAYDIDLFDTPASAIAALKAAGRRVICYFSAGSFEDWRPDAGSFPAAALGNPLDGWPGESWLDTSNASVRTIMRARMDLAVSKGCDAVDPDNVDAYTNGTGLPLTAATQLDYNRFLASEAHARGLAVGLKNDLNQVRDLLASFDFAINEQCFHYAECDLVDPFISAGKPVFGIEYDASTSICAAANAANFDTLLKTLALDATRTSCR